MSLLTRTATLFSLLVLVFFSSCKDPQEIGLNARPPDQPLGVFFTDTVTVRTSTVLVDSVMTSNGSFLLAGGFEDPKLGKVMARSFFQLQSVDSILTFGEALQYDSLVFMLHYDYSYGDTTQLNTLSVHRLQADMDASRLYYSQEQVPYESAIIGSKNFYPLPRQTDSLRIKLSDDLGRELLALNGQYRKAFLNAFKGLALVPSDVNSSVIGFDAGGRSKIRMYYRAGNPQVAKYHDFLAIGANFNQIQSDRSKTSIATLQKPYDAIASSQTGEEAFVQAGIGLMTKIEFPYLKNFTSSGEVGIQKAELIIKPIESSTDKFRLPAPLILYPSNSLNQVAQQVVPTMDGTIHAFKPLVHDFSLAAQLAGYDPVRKTYTFGIGQYLAANLKSTQTENGLFLSVPSSTLNNLIENRVVTASGAIPADLSYEHNVSRLILGSGSHPTQAIKLRLYYIPIKKI